VQGCIQEFFQRGVKLIFIYMGEAQHPLGTEIHRFYWSRGGCAPIYAPENASAREDNGARQTNI